jgi:hypothetical protein
MLVVVKMRRSEHSIEMCECQITPAGIALCTPLRGYRGLASGIPGPSALQSHDLINCAPTRRKASHGPQPERENESGNPMANAQDNQSNGVSGDCGR